MSVSFASSIDANQKVSAVIRSAKGERCPKIPRTNALVPTGQEGKSINAVLPHVLIQKILEHLPVSADRSTALVCPLWSRVVPILPDPSLKVFGKEAWKDYLGFEIEGGGPPLPRVAYRSTRINRRRLAGENEAPPCTAILMPKELTLNKLRELMENPTNGNSTKFVYIWQNIVDELGDEPVEESYWFVITNDVIEGSRSISYAKQKALVGQKTKFECELPTLLEAIACCVMHYVSSKNHLFGRDLWTYTCCQEQIDDIPLTVGAFALGGFHVNHSRFDFGHYGAAASWKC